MHRIFSPPESTFVFLYTSSPEKSIRPKYPRKNISFVSGEYCASQSMSVSSFSKNEELSRGKYACVIVTPHSKVPVSAFLFPEIISNNAVIARGSFDIKIILSPFSTVNEMFLNKTSFPI